MLDLTQNYFQLFGLPVGFGVDPESLTERYRELQRIVHPDRYASGTEQERRLSMQGATFLNEALETLRDPLLRAHYLLRLKGAEAGRQHGQPMDPAFLMEQMELREELAELRHQPDPLAASEAFIGRVRRRVDELVGRLGEQFAADALPAASESVRELQFLRKLQLEAENLEAELEDELL
jgi:molecular chaperone HscB